MVLGLVFSIIIGLIFWSFWSVILSRWAESEDLKQASSIISWRSECPYCKTVLQAQDLIPLVSFFLQKWRCRYCKRKISRFYPILELGSAIICWVVWRFFSKQGIGITVFWMSTCRILWLMIVYDVIRYELHIPLLILATIILLLAIERGLFQWSALRWGVIFLMLFVLLYYFWKQLVKIRYHVDEEWLGMWDVFIAPYLWTLLFAALTSIDGNIDKTLAVLYFLIFTGVIWIVRFWFQSKKSKKRASRLLNQKVVNNSLPLLPSMIIAVLIIIIFQNSLFWTISF